MLMEKIMEKKLIQLPRHIKIPASKEESVRKDATTIKDEVSRNQHEMRSWFSENTIILGLRSDGSKGQGSIEVAFDVSSFPDSLQSANLKITTFRTHGGLHIPPNEATRPPDKYKQGNLYINDHLVDNIDLVKETPHGTDFGFNKLEPYPIVNWIEKSKRENNGILKIKLEVDQNVLWDVDEISIEDIIYESKELKQWVWMVCGALLSVIVGSFVTILIK